MTRPRSLRTAFSKSSGFLAMLAAVMPWKLTPPILALSLWQPTQYCLMVASCASAESALGWWARRSQRQPGRSTAISEIEVLMKAIVGMTP